MTYSALAGGDKQAALKAAAKDLVTGSNVASIDLINEIGGDDGEDEALKAAAGEIIIPRFPKLLPYITSRGNSTLKGVELYLKSRAGIPENLTARVEGKEPDTKDPPGDFIVRSSEELIDMAKTWTVKLKDGESAWEGAFDEAWLLISYNVTGLVKG
ncbi:hypothetical protein BJX65DRAFT_300962 [Aspergillus insuetus]